MLISYRCFLTVFLCGFANLAAVHAEDIDNKKGVLSRLAPEIGTYNSDKVLGDPSVSAELQRRLGTKGMAMLKERLVVQGPIAFDGTSLVLHGGMAHAADTDAAIVSVRPRDGQVQVAIRVGGREVLQSIDQFMPQSPQGDVQRQAVEWAKASGSRVRDLQPSAR